MSENDAEYEPTYHELRKELVRVRQILGPARASVRLVLHRDIINEHVRKTLEQVERDFDAALTWRRGDQQAQPAPSAEPEKSK